MTVAPLVFSVLQQGEVNFEKSAITLKYAMDAERLSEHAVIS